MDVIEGLTCEDERILHNLCVIELGRVQDHQEQLDYGKNLVAIAVKLQRSMEGRQERGDALIGSIVTETHPEAFGRTEESS